MTSNPKGLCKIALDAGDVDVASYLSGARHKKLTRERAKALADERPSVLGAGLKSGLKTGGLAALAAYALTDPKIRGRNYSYLSHEDREQNALGAGIAGLILGGLGGAGIQSFKNDSEKDQLRAALG